METVLAQKQQRIFSLMMEEPLKTKKINLDNITLSESDNDCYNQHKKQFTKQLFQYPTPQIYDTLELHPYDTSDVFSKCLLSLMCSLMLIGNNKILEIKDLTSPTKKLQLNYLYDRFLEIK